MSSEIIQKRHRLLSDIASGCELRQNYPLIKEAVIPPALFEALQRAVGEYIYAAVAKWYGPCSFDSYETFVQERGDDILALPNVTPNGVIRPKRETYLEYNVIHRRVQDIIRTLKLDQSIVKMRLPLTLRMVAGTASDWTLNRPRANNRMHSDFWTGGVCDLAFLLPILGDVSNTTVRFAEPVGMADDFLQELPRYEDGEKLYDSYVDYDMTMEKGHLYLQDIYCLHGTSRNGGGFRVSMDWTIQTKNYPEVENFYSSDALSKDNHFDLEEWYSLGQEWEYFDSETMSECDARFSNRKQESPIFLGSAIADQTSPHGRIIDVMATTTTREPARFSDRRKVS